jgi:hypothetical protein
MIVIVYSVNAVGKLEEEEWCIDNYADSLPRMFQDVRY